MIVIPLEKAVDIRPRDILGIEDAVYEVVPKSMAQDVMVITDKDGKEFARVFVRRLGKLDGLRK